MKIKLIAIALSGALLSSGAAQAEGCDFDPKFYVGGELQGNKLRGAKQIETDQGIISKAGNNKPLFDKTGVGGSLFAGSRFNDFMGVEVGADIFNNQSFDIGLFKNVAAKNSSAVLKKVFNVHADALGYLPVTDRIDVIGSVGLGYLSSQVKGRAQATTAATGVVIDSKASKVGARVGAGVNVKVLDCLSVRAMARYQQGNKHIKSVSSVGLGLTYEF